VRKIQEQPVEPLDLGKVAGGALMKRALPVLGALLLVFLLLRRRRHH
jgi:hypothetical protein